MSVDAISFLLLDINLGLRDNTSIPFNPSGTLPDVKALNFERARL